MIMHVFIDLRDFQEQIDRVQSTLSDGLGDTGRAIAEEMRADALAQFQMGGDPAWAPLKPETIAEKRRMGYPRLSRNGRPPTRMIQNGHFGPENILERTGALLSSWTDASDPHHIEEIGPDFVAIGSSLSYAAAHQFGQPPHLPQRAINISQASVNRVADILSEALN